MTAESCCAHPYGCQHRALPPLPADDYSRSAQAQRWAEQRGRRYGASHRTVDIPFWTAPVGYCRWCGEPLAAFLKSGARDPRVRWHGPCATAYNAQQPGAQRRRIVARDGRTCRSCGVACGNGSSFVGGPPYAIDHIIPLIDGGANEDANLQVLCEPCHKVKTAREATERARLRRETGHPA